MYASMFGQFQKTLTQLSTWLDAAERYATERKFDANILVHARLAPDQFALARQVQIACDTAKLGASRLTGKTAPTHADDEATLADLRARVASVLEYLRSFTSADYDGAATRVVTQPRWEGKVMSGNDYFLEHVVPNFFFHATHVYALLRHNGVPVGKKDFLGALSQRPG